MLRIIVISLVVANLFLLGFQGTEPEAQKEAVAHKRVAGDPRIPTIHLFSEIMEDQDLLSGSRHCFSIGPFHSEPERDEVFTSLLDISDAVTERETQALVEKGYWVFMPPYISLLEANQELLSLKALGLEDISIIYEGEWQNAISLGYFLRQDNAQRRKKALEEKGYQPMIRVQRRSEARYWLDYELAPGSALLSLDMSGRPNDFMQRPLPCPEQRMPVVSKAVDTPAAASPEPFDDPALQGPVAENIVQQPEPEPESAPESPEPQTVEGTDPETTAEEIIQDPLEGESDAGEEPVQGSLEGESDAGEETVQDPSEGEPDAPVESTPPQDGGADTENPDTTDTDG